MSAYGSARGPEYLDEPYHLFDAEVSECKDCGAPLDDDLECVTCCLEAHLDRNSMLDRQERLDDGGEG
mgnify:FL=1